MGIQTQLEETYILIRPDCKALNEDEARRCIDAVNEQGENRPLIILDFKSVFEIGWPALRVLTRAVSAAAHSDRKYSIVARHEVLKFIRNQGLDRLFGLHLDAVEAIGGGKAAAAPAAAPAAAAPAPLRAAPAQEPASGAVASGASVAGAAMSFNDAARPSGVPVDPLEVKQRTVEFVNVLLDAVAYTLRVSTQTHARAGKSYARGTAPAPQADIAATVGVLSPAFNGTVVLGFQKESYLTIMSKFLAMEYTEITPDVEDGAAELLNVILGQAKVLLNDRGFELVQAVPAVIAGKEIRVFPAFVKRSILVPFQCELGSFYLEVATTADRGTRG